MSNYCHLRSKFCFNSDTHGQCTLTAPCVENNPQFITTVTPSESYISIKFINTCPKCGCQFENTGEIIQNYAQIIRWYETKKYNGFEEFIPHARCGNCGKEFANPSAVSKFCPNCGKEMIGVNAEGSY